MDKYEYRVKTEQMMEHVEKKQYKKAMEIADTIDWRRVKNASMLNTVSEIYEFNGEFQKSRDILFVAFDRAPSSRKIVYRLGILALKIQDTEEASDCYEEFVKLAPKDPNQYILKYKILKAQGSPLSEQISALSEFKKAEYVEKWAYELAKLYHEAGMTAECLEECDDLILWFSEGKYVYQAMELKMHYKPLTPLQQEKYDSYGGKKGTKIRRPQAAARPVPKKEDPSAQRPMVKSVPQTTAVFSELPEEALSSEEGKQEQAEEKQRPDETRKFPTGELTKALAAMEAQNEKLEEELPEEDADASGASEEKGRTPITTIVKGATLEEALANGVAMANGINREEKRKMEQREEEIRISGQMKIEDILQEWEEKQKANAEAIEEQRVKDEERFRKEREEREARREAERLEAEKREAEAVARRKAEAEAKKEAERKAAEEAARKEAERKAAEEAARKEAERKAAEETARKEAERKAAEEEARVEAERKAAEETARKETERKTAEEAEIEAGRKAAEETSRKKAGKKVKKTPMLSDDIRQLVEELEGKVAEEEKFEIDDSEEMDDNYQMELKFLMAGDEETASDDEAIDEAIAEFDFVPEDGFDEGEPEVSAEEYDETEPNKAEDGFEDGFNEDSFEEAEEEYEEAGLDEDDLEESEEEYEEDDLEESGEEYEKDSSEEPEEYDEDGFEESEEEYDEDSFEEPEEEYDEDSFEEPEEEYDEDSFEEPEEEYDEDSFEEPEEEYDEDSFDEAEDFDDYDEAEFEEDEFEEEEFNEDDFEEEEEYEEGGVEEEEYDEDEFEEDEFDEEDFFDEEELPQVKGPEKEAPLEIEEPSEEEIQKRIKKSKGSGVPFDTGFVVTGRYDLSATSEIGLKAGLTEEQKKLFSYFVPVRGMSEQIVEALDNDRRAQREGTSRTGNLLVIGRKGSGKTVLAVDIVKAIQKQRNLKQGKVAIVTGESLNKKELSNIIQKLRGGAIIIEKAGKLNSRTIKELSLLMEKKTGEMLFVLEDQRKPLERILTAHPDFKKKFTSRLELPVFINDELVTFGQTYAKENGYKLDEMGILALYSRIDVMQREDHAVTVAEVKDIMDEAIAHSQKANVKHLARRMFGKSTDSSDRIILKEEDFKI